jgi:hypothetical protein
MPHTQQRSSAALAVISEAVHAQTCGAHGGSRPCRDANDCGRPPSRERRLAPSPPAGNERASTRSARQRQRFLLYKIDERQRFLLSCSVRIVILEFGLGRLTAREHQGVDRLPHRAKLTDPSSGSGRRPAPAGLGQRAAPKRSGPGRPGALPACPPGSRLLGCGPWAPAAGSRPATRHRLGSPVPR